MARRTIRTNGNGNNSINNNTEANAMLNNTNTVLSLPLGRNRNTDNILEAVPVTNTASPSIPANNTAPSLTAHSTVYAPAMFNLNNPASVRLPLLAAHIVEAMDNGKQSTCAIYNWLRDVRGWQHLPGSVAFRAQTEQAGLLNYTGRNGKPVTQGHRTHCTEGTALRSIARCYIPATGTEA